MLGRQRKSLGLLGGGLINVNTMSKKQTIHFVLTGGTIDSYYNGVRDTATPNKTSVIPGFIESLRLYEQPIFTEVCMKDSRSLTVRDLNAVVRVVEKSKSQYIIITHGTYTMPDTARYLQARLRRTDQTIIFTGSMIPLVGFTPSDGPFNLGFALAKVRDLPPGMYVAMNGKVFTPAEVAKLLYQGRFISIFSGADGKKKK